MGNILQGPEGRFKVRYDSRKCLTPFVNLTRLTRFPFLSRLLLGRVYHSSSFWEWLISIARLSPLR
jgi:hypothetical protein